MPTKGDELLSYTGNDKWELPGWQLLFLLMIDYEGKGEMAE